MTVTEGKIIIHNFESSLLKSNPLKDPYNREIIVYVPHDFHKVNPKGSLQLLGFQVLVVMVELYSI